MEMELAGMQAVCDSYNIDLYDFLVTGDVVDQTDYTGEGLHEANHDLGKFYVALKLAGRIANRFGPDVAAIDAFNIIQNVLLCNCLHLSGL